METEQPAGPASGEEGGEQKRPPERPSLTRPTLCRLRAHGSLPGLMLSPPASPPAESDAGGGHGPQSPLQPDT